MPALLNYTAVDQYYRETDPKVLKKMLLSPRKVFSGVKVVSERESKLYNKKSKQEKKNWHSTFDKTTNLPHRGDAYHVEFKSGLDDSTIVAFKTDRERSIEIGRDYLFEPMDVGECRVVQKKGDTDRNIKDGEIIFIKQGPFNFMPLVEQYEKQNKEVYGGTQKAIIEGKHGLSDRELNRRERGLINAYIKYPCRAFLIEDAKGKAPSSLKSAIYVEYDNYLKLISQYLPEPLH